MLAGSEPPVVLQPFDRGDCQTLASWLPDPYSLVMTAPDWIPPITAEQIERSYFENLTGGEALKAVMDDRMVGHLGMRVLNGGSTGHLFHVIIDPGLRGKGHGLAMMRAIERYAFVERGLNRIQLQVFDDNAPAIACYIRAGFRIEGHHLETTRVGDRWLNTYSMALLRGEWEQAPQKD